MSTNNLNPGHCPRVIHVLFQTHSDRAQVTRSYWTCLSPSSATCIVSIFRFLLGMQGGQWVVLCNLVSTFFLQSKYFSLVPWRSLLLPPAIKCSLLLHLFILANHHIVTRIANAIRLLNPKVQRISQHQCVHHMLFKMLPCEIPFGEITQASHQDPNCLSILCFSFLLQNQKSYNHHVLYQPFITFILVIFWQEEISIIYNNVFLLDFISSKFDF